ncbi:hypothetical protein ACIRP5_10065 [Streptomyces sp. NPDC101221]|uniref:hypothetical protein n=1 Tax=Streptomyces sp. NPDC101221 TaxID=3366132 RepID=UPI0037FD8C7C
MWIRYARPHEGDPLGRDDWFTMRSEDGTDGRVTLVLVDWVAGDRPDVTRLEMAREAAIEMTEETGAALLSEGWKMDAPPNLYRPW